MNRFFLAFAFSAFLVTSNAGAAPETWNQQLEKISEIANAELKKNHEGTDGKATLAQTQIKTILAGLQAYIAQKDYASAIQNLQLLSRASPGTASACSSLASEMITQLHKQLSGEIGSLSKLYEDFGKAIIVAETPADIDPWFKKLNQAATTLNFLNQSNFRNQHLNTSHLSFSSPQTAELVNKVQLMSARLSSLQSYSRSAIQIASLWQDYLQNLSNGDVSKALSALTSVARLAESFDSIPRSKVLDLSTPLKKALAQPDEKASKVVPNIELLRPQLQKKYSALIAYEKLNSFSSSQLDAETLSLKKLLLDYKSGIAKLDSGSFNQGFLQLTPLSDHPVLGSLVSRTINEYLAKTIHLPDSFSMKPEESPRSWSPRYLNQLADSKSWTQMLFAINIISQYYPSNYSKLSNPIAKDHEALELLITAINYEESKQIRLAMVAYRQVISKAISFKQITTTASQRLQSLRKQHPTEYKESLTQSRHDVIPRIPSPRSTNYGFSEARLQLILRKEISAALDRAARATKENSSTPNPKKLEDKKQTNSEPEKSSEKN